MTGVITLVRFLIDILNWLSESACKQDYYLSIFDSVVKNEMRFSFCTTSCSGMFHTRESAECMV